MSDHKRPYLRWVGSKQRILSHVLDAIGEVKGTFIEPFVGTGAVALNVKANNYILNDLNHKLITTHKMIINFPNEVIDILLPLLEEGRDNYYQLRDQFNTATDPLSIAALFIYLNRTGFQGLYRENLKGHFNTPVGSGNIKKNNNSLLEFNDYFQLLNYKFSSDDSCVCIQNAKQGDVIYMQIHLMLVRQTRLQSLNTQRMAFVCLTR